MTLNLPFFRQLAKALAKQFGDNCEVVLHDLTSTDIEHSVVLVENGHVTHRAVGDGPSHVVLEAMKAMGARGSAPTDHLAYLTKTGDGRILKLVLNCSGFINDVSFGGCSVSYNKTRTIKLMLCHKK